MDMDFLHGYTNILFIMLAYVSKISLLHFLETSMLLILKFC